MRPARFLAQVVAWLAALAILNVVIARAARNSVPRAVARAIDTSPPVTDLFLGNSLVQAGADPSAFAAAAPGSSLRGVGLGSSSPVEHDVLLRRGLRLEPRRVLYGYYDDQLFRRHPSGFGDLVGNRAMAYYLDPETAIGYYAAGDPLRAWQMRLVGRLPMLVERTTLWAKVERLRRRLGEIGLGAVATNRFGRVEDFGLLEAANGEEFRRLCAAILADRRAFDAPVVDLIERSRATGARVVLIEMPMAKSHRERFYDQPEWRRLRSHIREQAARLGAECIDASAWIGDEGFADYLHLNRQGAAEFSARLAKAVAMPPR